MRVFNARGQLVQTLVDSELTAGPYEIGFNAIGLASGVYFYRLEFVDFTATRKLVVLK